MEKWERRPRTVDAEQARWFHETARLHFRESRLFTDKPHPRRVFLPLSPVLSVLAPWFYDANRNGPAEDFLIRLLSFFSEPKDDLLFGRTDADARVYACTAANVDGWETAVDWMTRFDGNWSYFMMKQDEGWCLYIDEDDSFSILSVGEGSIIPPGSMDGLRSFFGADCFSAPQGARRVSYCTGKRILDAIAAAL